MTARVYYDDAYLNRFRAEVVEARGNAVYLDRSAFYPTSGGQPFDQGTIGGVAVLDVVDEGQSVRHDLASPLPLGDFDCQIDWQRRFDHMQQHTGQHVLSAVLVDRFGYQTVSFHLGQDTSTIDIDAESLSAEQIVAAEAAANAVILENRPVTVSYHDASSPDIGLRKATERTGVIRVVSIENLDRSACGGTHVRATGEVGFLQIRRLDRIRGIVRIEFVCGWRAIRRARADFDALARIARVYSSALDDAPAMVESQRERLADADKALRKLSLELAQFRGRQLYESTTPLPNGLRLHTRRLAAGITDEVRAEAQAFTTGPQAAFVAASESPSAILLAMSPGRQAGATLKPLLSKWGGRGGGNPQLAQGSLPSAAALDSLVAELLALLSE